VRIINWKVNEIKILPQIVRVAWMDQAIAPQNVPLIHARVQSAHTLIKMTSAELLAEDFVNELCCKILYRKSFDSSVNNFEIEVFMPRLLFSSYH
jgi:hypothetical protein